MYRSRIEAISNSISEYILIMDPDDMYLNPNLFQEIYNYNLKNNLDIIEFSVFQQKDGEKKYFYQIIIMRSIIMDFQKKLFLSQNYLIYYTILQVQKNIVKPFVEIFGTKL